MLRNFSDFSEKKKLSSKKLITTPQIFYCYFRTEFYDFSGNTKIGLQISVQNLHCYLLAS
jgi:hypothetical protein